MSERRHAAREGLGVCVVTEVVEVTPRMRRVTFAGDGLKGALATGADQRVKLSFPTSHQFTGDPQEAALARRRRRTYTLLHLDSERGQATVDFVLHPGGVAAEWAAAAGPGDELMLTAPVGGFEVPADATEVVLVADETGLPALQAIAAQLPAGLAARAFVEVADAAEEQPIPGGVDGAVEVSVTWLHRDGAPHGEPMTALSDSGSPRALVSTVSPQAVVWIAGEAAAVRTLRNALVTGVGDSGMDRHRIDAVAYWTKQV